MSNGHGRELFLLKNQPATSDGPDANRLFQPNIGIPGVEELLSNASTSALLCDASTWMIDLGLWPFCLEGDQYRIFHMIPTRSL